MHHPLRFAVIGLGKMGTAHATLLSDGRIRHAELAAVCDTDATRLHRFPRVRHFSDPTALLHAKQVDAVLIATPHAAHAELCVTALAAGLHVLCEKPMGLHLGDSTRMVAAWRTRPRPEQLLGVVYNLRTDPRIERLRQLIADGELGRIQRVTWTVTDCFRTHRYYGEDPWRGSWAGAGGGVVVNQCTHQLDLLCRLLGLPKRVTARLRYGQRPDMACEESATALLDWGEDGPVGTFTCAVDEAPGINRLELAGDRGVVVVEGGRMTWQRCHRSNAAQRTESTEVGAKPECWEVGFHLDGPGGQQAEILANFTAACLDGAPLLCSGEDALAAITLADAIILSGIHDKPVDLPLDPAKVDKEFKRLAHAEHAHVDKRSGKPASSRH